VTLYISEAVYPDLGDAEVDGVEDCQGLVMKETYEVEG
jgi:hypothetical protein